MIASFITGVLTRFGLSWLSSLLGGAVANFIEPLVRAIIALVRGILEIIVDLSRSFEGRIVLAAISAGLAGWYLYATYDVVERREVAAYESTIAEQKAQIAQLSKRPAQCPALKKR
jgi:hypothetical protein